MRDTIRRLNDQYYNHGQSDVSDEVYDSLKRTLAELERYEELPDSPTGEVGAPSTDTLFQKSEHPSQMLSLANVFDREGMYQMYAQADDIFDFYMNGEQKAYGGGQFTKQIIVTESKYYALKVSNTPANTPSYWTCAMVNTVTGEVVLRPEPGVWKTQEYSAG